MNVSKPASGRNRMQAPAPEQGAPRQLHLSCFAPHELLVWEQDARRKLLRKEQRVVRPTRRFWVREDRITLGLFDSLDLAVLEQPLGGPAEGNELNCIDLFLESSGSADDEPDECQEAWSDRAVEELHESVLHYSLKALQARGNGAEKREILQWIFAPEPMVIQQLNAAGAVEEVALPQHLTPFSFERCCRICRLRSENLMDGLRPILDEMGLGNFFNELANGRNNPNYPSSGNVTGRTQDQDVPPARNLQPA